MYRDDGPRGGAEHLARIHGTEEDKVICRKAFDWMIRNICRLIVLSTLRLELVVMGTDAADSIIDHHLVKQSLLNICGRYSFLFSF